MVNTGLEPWHTESLGDVGGSPLIFANLVNHADAGQIS